MIAPASGRRLDAVGGDVVKRDARAAGARRAVIVLGHILAHRQPHHGRGGHQRRSRLLDERFARARNHATRGFAVRHRRARRRRRERRRVREERRVRSIRGGGRSQALQRQVSRARASHETLEPNRHALHQRDVQRRRGGSGALGSPRARHVFDLRDRRAVRVVRVVRAHAARREPDARLRDEESTAQGRGVFAAHERRDDDFPERQAQHGLSLQRGGGGNLRLDLRRGVAVGAALREELQEIQRPDASAVRRAHGAARASRPRDPGAAAAGHDRLDLPPVLAHDLDGWREPQVQQTPQPLLAVHEDLRRDAVVVRREKLLERRRELHHVRVLRLGERRGRSGEAPPGHDQRPGGKARADVVVRAVQNQALQARARRAVHRGGGEAERSRRQRGVHRGELGVNLVQRARERRAAREVLRRQRRLLKVGHRGVHEQLGG